MASADFHDLGGCSNLAMAADTWQGWNELLPWQKAAWTGDMLDTNAAYQSANDESGQASGVAGSQTALPAAGSNIANCTGGEPQTGMGNMVPNIVDMRRGSQADADLLPDLYRDHPEEFDENGGWQPDWATAPERKAEIRKLRQQTMPPMNCQGALISGGTPQQPIYSLPAVATAMAPTQPLFQVGPTVFAHGNVSNAVSYQQQQPQAFWAQPTVAMPPQQPIQAGRQVPTYGNISAAPQQQQQQQALPFSGPSTVAMPPPSLPNPSNNPSNVEIAILALSGALESSKEPRPRSLHLPADRIATPAPAVAAAPQGAARRTTHAAPTTTTPKSRRQGAPPGQYPATRRHTNRCQTVGICNCGLRDTHPGVFARWAAQRMTVKGVPAQFQCRLWKHLSKDSEEE